MYKVIWLLISPMHGPRTLILYVLFSVVLCSMACAQDFCALTANITNSSRLPTTSTWVELLDESGHVELRQATDGPMLRICDFGFGPHTLRVGTNECLPVTISNLRLVIGSPLHLNVIINNCGYRETVRSTCLLYLRAVDTDGKPVSDADILLKPFPAIPPKTDSYGRFQDLFRGDQDIILTKQGFEQGKAHAQCREKEELDIKVIMSQKKVP